MLDNPEAVVQGCSLKKVFLEISQNSRPATFLKKSLAQVFSCEFCKISKNTFFTEHLRWLLLLMFFCLFINEFNVIVFFSCQW